jgi:hypothetical protein
VAELPENVPSFFWFPDSRWVVADGLVLLSTETGEIGALTSALKKPG